MEVASGLKLFAKNIVNIVIDSSVLWNLTTMYSLASRRTALAPWWALGSGAISARWSPLRLSKIILVGPRKKILVVISRQRISC